MVPLYGSYFYIKNFLRLFCLNIQALGYSGYKEL